MYVNKKAYTTHIIVVKLEKWFLSGCKYTFRNIVQYYVIYAV